MTATTTNRRSAIVSTLAAAAALTRATSGQPVFAAPGKSEQWWGWRGPSSNNHAAPGSQIPNVITESQITWSVNIPGRGHSSPIVVSDSLFLTTADKQAGTQSVVSISRSGKLNGVLNIHQGGIPAENHNKNTEASPTLAYDGEALLAVFYNGGAIRLTRLTTKGKVLWQKKVGDYRPQQYKYGYAASPIVYQDRVIINVDFDGASFITALDCKTGNPIWRVARPGKLSFSSPIVANLAGRDQILLSGCQMVAAYDPSNGGLLWKAAGATTMATCGTLVWDDQNVYASGGYPKAETVCVAGDGSGKILWSNRTKCYEQSLLSHNGYIYAAADSGVAYCWRATDGKTMWQQRLGGKFSSSPILVGDTIHVFNERGMGFAFAASPDKYESRGQSRVGDEVFASPAVVDNTMYLRVAKNAKTRQESLLAIA